MTLNRVTAMPETACTPSRNSSIAIRSITRCTVYWPKLIVPASPQACRWGNPARKLAFNGQNGLAVSHLLVVHLHLRRAEGVTTQMRKSILFITTFLLAGSAFGFPLPFKKKKYETPITRDTLQHDKDLFDRAINDIEHGNYESARIVLNTLINTYDTSEYLAKASLAIADSWYREGGPHGLAQAEAQYKEFILFFPNMTETAESQYKVCEIHYKQMQAADRDSSEATRAEDECRQVIRQFPNSPQFAAQAAQLLLEAQ